MNKKIIIVGSGVAGINAATELVDNGYPGDMITIIDKGQDPYNRPSDEVMLGFAGAGLKSDGKYILSTHQGGQLSKYCGEDKALELMNKGLENIKRFHPDPSQIAYSNPTEEPEFIKPYFTLRMSPTYHVGTNYLKYVGENWYNYLVDKGVTFYWETEVTDIDFEVGYVYLGHKMDVHRLSYDELIYCTGKSGMELTQQLITEFDLPFENKAVQLGVRFEAPQKYFQKILDIAYDFKLYRKIDNVSIRTFCVNSNAAFIAAEKTFGDTTYNGHSKNGEQYRNDMVNFGIIMEIEGIENPFEWSRNIVRNCQVSNTGIYYSPDEFSSIGVDGWPVSCVDLNERGLEIFKEVYGEYAHYVLDFIEDLDKVFGFYEDFGIYFPEVKYASDEVLVNYDDLSLIDYPNVHFVGDALSSRGIASASGQGLLCTSKILKNA